MTKEPDVEVEALEALTMHLTDALEMALRVMESSAPPPGAEAYRQSAIRYAEDAVVSARVLVAAR